MHNNAQERLGAASGDHSEAPEHFRALLADFVSRLGRPELDETLERWLNHEHGPAGTTYGVIREACLEGVRAGWMCSRGGGSLRYGRVLKPADDLQRFSVDVVAMENVVAPHHVHPAGEVNLVMPVTGDACFDGRGAGWRVYPPGSSHSPEVIGGSALVLYLLPEGKIEFTGR
jgi:hypothetical protein